MERPKPTSATVFALGVLGLAACGPVEYVSQLANRAPRAITQARRQGAERLAPYEYTAAVEYLREAREQAARSSYQRALDYGLKAEELAERAEAIAREKKSQHPDGVPPAPGTPPP